MAIEHARRSKAGEVDERAERAREPEPTPPAVQAALWMQQTSGNQAVARMLSRAPRTVARFDKDFMFNDAKVEKEALTFANGNLRPVVKAAEQVIEDELGGIEALWRTNGTVNSVNEWARLVISFMSDRYAMVNVDENVVVRAVAGVKDEHREAELKRLAFNRVFSAAVQPWSAGNFAQMLIDEDVFLEYQEENDGSLSGPDGPALERLYETGGEFARKKVTGYDMAKNEELLDEDDVVVIIDHHQNKHQHPEALITRFGQYQGDPGTKFAANKTLEWHRTNTALTVKETVLEAVRNKDVTEAKDWAPPKDAIDGIQYDLGIAFDPPTGKWVGSYHCNPVVSEFWD